jgi:hypothetical protein
MSAPGQQLPKYDELVERIAKLEADRKVTLKDLPMSALMSALENDWRPNQGLLLGTLAVVGGQAVVTFGGVVTTSGTTTIATGLDVVTTAVAVGAGTGGGIYNATVDLLGGGSIRVALTTTDGTVPGAGVQRTVNWIAIGTT